MPHLSLNYIDRGDPSEYDFTKEDFDTDSQWHDLDLSNIIPEGVELVHIRVRIASPSLGAIQFRRKGNINLINTAVIKIQVANVYYYEDFFIACDCNSNRKIQYLASNIVWTTLDFSIRGWFEK